MAVRVDLNLRGLNALMTSQPFIDCIQEASEAVASEARAMSGEDYGTEVKVQGKSYVAIGNVFPNSKEAAQDNYDFNTLEKAIGAVGLNRQKGVRNA